MTLINYLFTDLSSTLITFLKGFTVYFCFASFVMAIVYHLIGLIFLPVQVYEAKMSAKRFIAFQAVMLAIAVIAFKLGYQLIIRFFH